GTATNEVLNITSGGVVEKVTPAALVSAGIQADNGTSVGTGANAGKVVLGGALNTPTTVTTDATNTLTIAGLQAGAGTDGIVTNAGGVLKNMSSLTNAQVDDNLTINGGTINNSPIGATTASTGKFTTIEGTMLPNASASTDIVTSNGGALETRTLASFSSALAGSGLHDNAGKIDLGGTLTSPANIATTATNDLTVSGPGAANVSTTGGLNVTNTTTTGQLVVNNPALSPATFGVGGVKIGTGGVGPLTVDGATLLNSTLNVSGTTTLGQTNVNGGFQANGSFNTTNANVTMNGLASGLASNDVLVIDGGNQVKRVTASSYAGMLAGNGLTANSGKLDLGGTLTAPVTLTTSAANTITVAGLQADAGTDEIVTSNGGVLRKSASLTNAQVNDNLTINGGTIDNSPIGATTPSTAKVTTLTATAIPTGTATNEVLNITSGGVVEKVTPAALVSAGIQADNGTSVGTGANAGKVVLGGKLNQATTIDQDGNTLTFDKASQIKVNGSATAGTVNQMEINLTNVGGSITSGEQDQGVNVLATAENGAALAVGLRSRLLLATGSTATQVRGLSANSFVSGTVNSAATGAYFNSKVSGGTLGTNAILSGVSADAEASGSNTVGATNFLVGGRFGADATNANAANAMGSLAASAGSNVNNFGSVGVTNDPTFAGLGGFLASLPSVSPGNTVGIGVLGYNGAAGDNNYAGYFSSSNDAPTGVTLKAENIVTTSTSNHAVFGSQSEAQFTGTPSQSSFVGALTGSRSHALSAGIDYQAQGAMMESEVNNPVDDGSGGLINSVGGFGMATISGTSTGATNSFALGLSGGANLTSGSAINVIGVDGFVNYGDVTTGVTAGGNFDGAGAGAENGTEFGVVGTVGGSQYQTLTDGALTGMHISMAATNYASADATHLALYTEGDSRMNGKLLVDNTTAVGTTTPNSGLDVNSSVGAAIRTTSASTTLGDDDYTLIVQTGSSITITLPAASSSNARRIYNIINSSGGSITVGAFLNYAGASTTTISNASKITIQSDGSDWYQIN
ncbi:MAG: hypothetical protein JST36_00725, partial [Bacteroidetes bacterium]|nr:hypothetical protein [Bacteroidota bacterium]